MLHNWITIESRKTGTDWIELNSIEGEHLYKPGWNRNNEQKLGHRLILLENFSPSEQSSKGFHHPSKRNNKEKINIFQDGILLDIVIKCNIKGIEAASRSSLPDLYIHINSKNATLVAINVLS